MVMRWVSCYVVLLLCFSDGVGSCRVVKIVRRYVKHTPVLLMNHLQQRDISAIAITVCIKAGTSLQIWRASLFNGTFVLGF